MPHRGQIASDTEIQGAGEEGLKGAINGAATWGIGFLLLGVAANVFSPVYRNLTFQFKVYLQMSGMTVGACIEADKRLRAYEVVARRMRRVKREQEMWRQYEDAFQQDPAQQDSRGGRK